jgi:hypothetical protein
VLANYDGTSLDDLKKLTPFQLVELYFHPRNQKGEVEIEWKTDDPAEKDGEALFVREWIGRGLTRKQAEAKYLETILIEDKSAELRQKHPAAVAEAKLREFVADLRQRRTWA